MADPVTLPDGRLRELIDVWRRQGHYDDYNDATHPAYRLAKRQDADALEALLASPLHAGAEPEEPQTEPEWTEEEIAAERVAFEAFARRRKLPPEVFAMVCPWVDDEPDITVVGKPWTDEQLHEMRAWALRGDLRSARELLEANGYSVSPPNGTPARSVAIGQPTTDAPGDSIRAPKSSSSS